MISIPISILDKSPMICLTLIRCILHRSFDSSHCTEISFLVLLTNLFVEVICWTTPCVSLHSIDSVTVILIISVIDILYFHGAQALEYCDWLVTTMNDSTPDEQRRIPVPHPCSSCKLCSSSFLHKTGSFFSFAQPCACVLPRA